MFIVPSHLHTFRGTELKFLITSTFFLYTAFFTFLLFVFPLIPVLASSQVSIVLLTLSSAHEEHMTIQENTEIQVFSAFLFHKAQKKLAKPPTSVLNSRK